MHNLQLILFHQFEFYLLFLLFLSMVDFQLIQSFAFVHFHKYTNMYCLPTEDTIHLFHIHILLFDKFLKMHLSFQEVLYYLKFLSLIYNVYLYAPI